MSDPFSFFRKLWLGFFLPKVNSFLVSVKCCLDSPAVELS